MAMYLSRIWIQNGSVFVLEICCCNWIEMWKSNVFDLADMYLIPKRVFGPNPARVISFWGGSFFWQKHEKSNI